MEITNILERNLIPVNNTGKDLQNWKDYLHKKRKSKILLTKADNCKFEEVLDNKFYQENSISIKTQCIPDPMLLLEFKKGSFLIKSYDMNVEVLCELRLSEDNKPDFFQRLIQNMENPEEIDSMEAEFHASYEQKRGIFKYLKPISPQRLVDELRKNHQQTFNLAGRMFLISVTYLHNQYPHFSSNMIKNYKKDYTLLYAGFLPKKTLKKMMLKDWGLQPQDFEDYY